MDGLQLLRKIKSRYAEPEVILMTAFASQQTASDSSPVFPFTLPYEGIKLADIESGLLLSAIEKAKGNKTHAARLLGITRRRLYSLLEKHRVKK